MISFGLLDAALPRGNLVVEALSASNALLKHKSDRWNTF